jgi:hypothetical protein
MLSRRDFLRRVGKGIVTAWGLGPYLVAPTDGAPSAGILGTASDKASLVRWRETEGKQAEAWAGERAILAYRYDSARPKTYIHPLRAPNGFVVTRDGPPDHVHHRGLFLAWSGVNGFDFWGEVNPARHGVIRHDHFERLEAGNPAVLVALNRWVAEGETLLVERRTAWVFPPTEERTFLEWESELVAQEKPVTVDTLGHVYNGLGIRVARSMDGGRVLNANGTNTVQQANGEAARWCTYYGRMDETGWCGVAFFDAPDNPRHPTPYFVMSRPFGFLSAAPTFRKPFQLQPGERLRLRYGVLVYLGGANAERLERWYREWAKGSAEA